MKAKYMTRRYLYGNGVWHFICASLSLTVQVAPKLTWNMLLMFLEELIKLITTIILAVSSLLLVLSNVIFPISGMYRLLRALLVWKGRKMATLEDYPEDNVVWIWASGLTTGKECYGTLIKEGLVFYPTSRERKRYIQELEIEMKTVAPEIMSSVATGTNYNQSKQGDNEQ